MSKRLVSAFTISLTLAITTAARAEGPVAPPLPPPAPPSEPTPPPPPVGSSSSVRLTYESTKVDRPAEPPVTRSPDDFSLLHGFRLGYGYVANYDQPVEAFDGKSLKDKAGLRSPHHFLIGYEL